MTKWARRNAGFLTALYIGAWASYWFVMNVTPFGACIIIGIAAFALRD